MFDKNTSFETKFRAADYSEIGYIVQVDLKYPDKKQQKAKHLTFCPESKTVDIVQITDYFKKNIPHDYEPVENYNLRSN